MALRKLGIRGFLKKNFNFIIGILGEIGLTAAIIITAFIVCALLVFIRSIG